MPFGTAPKPKGSFSTPVGFSGRRNLLRSMVRRIKPVKPSIKSGNMSKAANLKGILAGGRGVSRSSSSGYTKVGSLTGGSPFGGPLGPKNSALFSPGAFRQGQKSAKAAPQISVMTGDQTANEY